MDGAEHNAVTWLTFPVSYLENEMTGKDVRYTRSTSYAPFQVVADHAVVL